mgnify:FL=1
MISIKLSTPYIQYEIGLDNLTVLAGTKGKSIFLKLFYSMSYVARHGSIPAELAEYISTLNNHEKVTYSLLNNDELIHELIIENNEGQPGWHQALYDEPYDVILFPTETDAYIKYGIPTLKYAYMKKLKALIDALNKQGKNKIELPKVLPRFSIEGKSIYQQLNENKKIKITESSASWIKIAFLTTIIENGLISKDIYMLFDKYEAGMHPIYQTMFAYLIGKLVINGYRIIITTNDLTFMSILKSIDKVPSTMGLEETFNLTPRLYVIDHTKTTEYSIQSSSIPTYNVGD